MKKLNLLQKHGFLKTISLFLTLLLCQTFFVAFQVYGQQVSGKVVSNDGEPLLGVSVAVKGTTQGTITDETGSYTLNVSSADAVLVFSFVGFTTEEVEVGSQRTINVTMTESITALDEIVVIGYGTVRKRDLTGAVVSVKGDDLNVGVQTSIDQMIKGQTAGVQVNTGSAEPGGGVYIRIRGANSITASNDPLYVIDGLPISNEGTAPSQFLSGQTQRNPLNALSPSDIESIEILKDASATAIYGARGANGVILITTKKGSGKFKVDYTTYFGTQSVAKKLDLLNAEEYMGFINQILVEQGEPERWTAADIAAAGEGTDWQDEIFRKAPIMNHSLAFSGGSGRTSYYASFNYLDQDGVIISSGMKTYTARLNLSHSTEKFNFGVNLNTSLVKDDYVKNARGVNAESGVVLSALQMDPSTPVYDDEGNYYLHPFMDVDNPVGLANTWMDFGRTNRTFGNVFGEYEIIKGLRAKVNIGADGQFSRKDEYVTKRDTRMGRLFNGWALVREQDRTNYLVEATLNYDKMISDIHHINAVAGWTYQQFDGVGISASATDYPTDAYQTNNLAAGNSLEYEINSSKWRHQLLSYLGRVNYTLLDRYLLTASFRVDGSSRFGADHKFGYFPSVAAAWRVSDEAFMSNIDVLSDLKVRASYGVTGNQEIGNYQSLLLLSVAGEAVFNDLVYVGIAPSGLANPDLRWETTAQFDAGIDIGFLNNRITGTFDVFSKNTYDLLLSLPIPRTSGFTASLQNIGDTKNTGFDFTITSRNLIGDFTWATTLIGSKVKNEVTNTGPLEQILTGGLRFAQNMTVIQEGYPMNSYWGFQVEGIFQTQAEVDASGQPTAAPGDLKIKDVSGDGIINDEDKTILGDPFPDFAFGLDNTFSYKGVSLSLFFEGTVGNEMLNAEIIQAEMPIETIRNRMDYVLDRWTPSNTGSENPSFSSQSLAYVINERIIEDASYLRLRTLRLSYAIPVKKIRSLSLFATGQNLFTLTNYRGYDPDVNTFGNSEIRADYSTYPLSRIYTIGLNVGF
jgi:TonB-linked SusC/RagA family outer membrane protein